MFATALEAIAPAPAGSFEAGAQHDTPSQELQAAVSSYHVVIRTS
jgi:hypothetical protein